MDEVVKKILREYIDNTFTDVTKIPEYHVLITWKCKALRNWKYLCVTTLGNGMYYELTYNGNKECWYLDAYKKIDNRVIYNNLN